jgi:dethiobiotin synthetase
LKFKSIFVTGTDTGVGKTTVSSGIAAALRGRACSVGVFKPAETGCGSRPDGQLLPQDAEQLKYFSGCDLDLNSICPYALKEPLAPLVAARREGVRIDVDLLVHSHERIAAAHDLTIIEGAGGLLVPIAPNVTFADLAARLDALVVVVVGSKLGAINHALLTIRHARSAGVCVVGYVINFLTAEPDVAARTNVEVLAEWIGPPLGVVPYLAELSMTDGCRRRLAELFAAQLRLDALLVPC